MIPNEDFRTLEIIGTDKTLAPRADELKEQLLGASVGTAALSSVRQGIAVLLEDYQRNNGVTA